MTTVLVEDHDAVRVVALNRPDQLNAINVELRMAWLTPSRRLT